MEKSRNLLTLKPLKDFKIIYSLLKGSMLKDSQKTMKLLSNVDSYQNRYFKIFYNPYENHIISRTYKLPTKIK